MVAIVTGSGLGFDRSSAFVLGSRGQVGAAGFGRDGSNVYVNAATGNLIVNRTDEFLVGQGPDEAYDLSYNSQANQNGGWLFGIQSQINGLTGTVNTAGSTVTRWSRGRTNAVYVYDAARGAYVNKEGAGAYDVLTYANSVWTWVDGDSRITETYAGTTSQPAPGYATISTRRDADGNVTSFTYLANSNTLSRITTTSGTVTEYTDIVLNAAGKPDHLTTTYVNASGATSSLTRVRLGFNAEGRIGTVTIDLSPEDNSIADGNVYTTSYTYEPGTYRMKSIVQSDGSRLDVDYVLVGADYRVSALTQTVSSGVTRRSDFSYDTANRVTTVTDGQGNVTRLGYDAAGQLVELSLPAAAAGGTAQVMRYAYNGNGDVVSATDAAGNVTVYDYDANGNQILVRDAMGNSVTRTYGAKNELLTETRYQVADPDGAGSGQPGGAMTSRFAYDGETHLRYAVSAEGRVTEYRYDAAGNQVGVIHYTGQSCDLSWLAPGAGPSEADMQSWVSAIADKSGTLRTDTSYDFRGNVSTVTTYSKVLASGVGDMGSDYSRTFYVYDQAGNLLSRQPGGSASAELFVYDGLGRIRSSTDLAGQTTSIAINDASGTTVVTLANGSSETSVYNLAGELISQTRSAAGLASSIVSYRYDGLGHLAVTTDASGLWTRLVYDRLGRKVAEIRVNGSIVEYGYDGLGRLARTISYANALSAAQMQLLNDANGNPAFVEMASLRPVASASDGWEWRIYDGASRLVETIDAAGAATSYAYDGAGRLLATTRHANLLSATVLGQLKAAAPSAPVLPAADTAKDRTERFFYDKDSNLVGTLDAEGYLIRHLYDAAGRQTGNVRFATATALAKRAAGSFDELHQSVTSPSSPNDIYDYRLYDGRGLLRAAIDGEGNLVRYAYNGAGFLTQEIRGQKLDPAALRVTAPTLANLPAAAAGTVLEARDYGRDAYGRLISEVRTLPGGATETDLHVYNSLGQLVRTVTRVSQADERVLTQRYDAYGRLTGTLSGEGSAVLAALGANPSAAAVDEVYRAYGTTYAYDESDRLISKTEADGTGGSSRTLYFYNMYGLVSEINALGEAIEYRYDIFGRRTDVIVRGKRLAPSVFASWTGGLSTTAANTALAGLADASVDSVVHTDYDVRGAASKVTDAMGALTTYAYNSFGELVSRVDPIDAAASVETSRSYDRRGLLVQERADAASGGLQLTSSFGYDAFGRLIQSVDAKGAIRSSGYDRAGRMVSSTDALGGMTSYGYDARGHVVSTTDRTGKTTTFAYSAFDRTMTVTTSEGLVTTTTRNAYGETLSIVDAAGRTVSYSYDRDGNLKTATDAAGTTSNAYDKAGRLFEATDANGVKARYGYDAAGRVLTRTVDPGGFNLVTSYEHDAKGQQVKVTDPAGIVTVIAYDANGRRTSVTVDPSGLALTTAYTYDKAGRTLTVTEASGTAAQRVTKNVYDKAGRLKQVVVDPTGLNLVTSFAYDANGNAVARTDANGNVTRFVYDAQGRLIYTLDAAGGLARTLYDGEGRVVATRAFANVLAPATLAGLGLDISSWLTDANIAAHIPMSAADRVTSFAYDGDGRLRFGVDALGTPVEHVYDGSGNVVRTIRYAGTISLNGTLDAATIASRIAAGGLAGLAGTRVTRTVYDAAGRVAFGIDAEGGAAAFTYDAGGNVLKQRLHAVRYTATGDPSLAAMQSWAAANGGTSDPVTRTVYDAAGRAAFGVDAEGYVTEYQYDAAGRVSKRIVYADKFAVADGATTASLRALVGSTIPASAAVTSFAYDKADRVTDTTDAAGIVTRMTYDALGQAVDTITAYGTSDAATTRRAYDAAGRVTSETRAYGTAIASTTGYTYDALGNVKTITNALGTVTLRDYDKLGRLTKVTQPLGGGVNAVTTQEYDAFGGVVKTVDANGGVAFSYYDKTGRMTARVDPENQLTTWTFDALGNVTAERRYATKAATVTTAAPPAVAANANDRVTSFAYDKEGRLRFGVDALGAPTEYIYDTLGNVVRTIRYAGTISLNGTLDAATIASRIAAGGLAGLAGTRITRTVYDAAGRVAFGIDAEGGAAAFTYDAGGNVLKQRLHAVRYTATGDPSLAAMQSWAAANGGTSDPVTRTVYDAAGRAAFGVDAEGYVTEYQYDAAGRVSKRIVYADKFTVADGATTASLRALVGSTIPASAAVTSFAYDKADRVTDTTDAAGIVTRMTYDVLGQVVDTITAYGTSDAATTRRAYDAAGRVTSETRAYGTAVASTTGYTYDALGNVVKVTDPRGYASYAYYDKLGRQTLAVDAEGFATETAYSVGGQVASVKRYQNRVAGTVTTAAKPALTTNAKDALTVMAYDKLDRLVSVTDAEGYSETYVLNAFGDRVSVTNKLGGVTTNTYDRLGRLVQETLPVASVRSDGSVQATSVVNRFDYDALGNLIKTTEAYGLTEQRTTIHVHDRNGRLTETRHDAVQVLSQGNHATFSTVTPTETIKYDARGNVIETVDASGARTLSYYDKMDRKIAEIGALGGYATYTYDADGNALTRRAYAGTVALPASPGGTPPAAPAGEYRESVSTYDRLGRLKTTSLAGVRTGGWTGTAYATQVATLVISYDYDASGNVIKATDANGGAVYSYYDKLGRKTAEVDKEAYLTAWTLDAEGNTLSERRYWTRAATVATTAPPAVAAHAEDRVTDFTYDRNGRRKSETRLGVLVSTVAATGALTTSVQNVTIGYDYNGLGQIVRKTEASGDYVDYGYDAVGRLLSEARAPFLDHNGVSVRPTLRHFYDGLNALTRDQQGGETASAGDRVTRYTYAAGRLETMTDAAGAIHSYAYDAAGTVLRESYSRQKADGSESAEGVLYTRDLLGRVTAQAIGTWNGSAWAKGDSQTMAYNGYGEMAQRGLNGLWQEQFAYDGAGRLWRTNSGDGVWRYFLYDANGNRTLALESEGSDLANKTMDQVLAIATQNGASSVGGAYVDGINATIDAFDKEGRAVRTILARRQLNQSSITDIATSRTYNGYGEVASETDARGYTTDFAYNAMGRLIEKKSPLVSWTAENGAVSSARPTETYHYDASGRLVGTRDANGNLVTRTLLEGSGYGGSEALVKAEYYADGTFRTFYDMFGDARVLRNELYTGSNSSASDELRAYDAMGRLVQQTHRGGLLTDYYVYDLLGQRIRHWNSMLGAGNAEVTDYDLQGRVTRQVAFGGDATSMTYSWSSSLATSGMGTFGGWTQITTYANGKMMTEASDMFGHTLSKTDLGGHAFTFGYDAAGRMIQRQTAGETLTTSYFNTGLVDTLATSGSNYTRYGYDAAGNKLSEFSFIAFAISQDASATYDALGRMTSWTEAGNAVAPASAMVFEYDLAGNVRRSSATYRPLDDQGAASATPATQDYWYRYDARGRMVTDKGVLTGARGAAGTTIARGVGGGGVDIQYDAAGRRRSVIRTVQLETSIHDPNAELNPFDPASYNPWMTVSYNSDQREDYDYYDTGEIRYVRVAKGGYVDNGDGTLTETAPAATGDIGSSFTYDAMGRMTRQVDWASYAGQSANYDRTIHYNAKGQIDTDTTITRQVTPGSGVNPATIDIMTNIVTYGFGSGTDYALGSVVTVDAKAKKNNDDSAAPDTKTTNSYLWFDGAVLGTSVHDPDTSPIALATHTTSYAYGASGQLQSVSVADNRPRTISFVNDLTGQAIRRKETDNDPQKGDPHEIWYRFDGKQLGYTGNNGALDADLDYISSAARRTEPQAQTQAAFRSGSTTSVAYADFDQNYDPINSFNQGSAGGSYTVKGGESLASIAISLWGDASLWYKLAEANGMTAASALAAGQRLTIPSGVVKTGNSASTFKPYDASETIGNINPTPKLKDKKCATFGTVLMIVVAAAVTAVVAPWATGALMGSALAGSTAATAAGIVGSAAGAAAGSIASQGLGVAIGMQDRIGLADVGLAAIGGAIGSGLGQIKALQKVGSKALQGALNGALGSTLTQGVAVATGLQEKFNWAGVAVGAVSGAVSGAIGPAPTRNRANRYHNRYETMIVSGTAGAIVGAAARSLHDGTDFGDNMKAALPSVIASTIGNYAADRYMDDGLLANANIYLPPPFYTERDPELLAKVDIYLPSPYYHKDSGLLAKANIRLRPIEIFPNRGGANSLVDELYRGANTVVGESYRGGQIIIGPIGPGDRKYTDRNGITHSYGVEPPASYIIREYSESPTLLGADLDALARDRMGGLGGLVSDIEADTLYAGSVQHGDQNIIYNIMRSLQKSGASLYAAGEIADGLYAGTINARADQVNEALRAQDDKIFSGICIAPNLTTMGPYQPVLRLFPRHDPVGDAVGEFFDGAIRGDFSEVNSLSGNVGRLVGGVNPAADVRDVTAGIRAVLRGKTGGWTDLGLASIGVIPGVGDAFKAVFKYGPDIAKHVDEVASLAEDIPSARHIDAPSIRHSVDGTGDGIARQAAHPPSPQSPKPGKLRLDLSDDEIDALSTRHIDSPSTRHATDGRGGIHANSADNPPHGAGGPDGPMPELGDNGGRRYIYGEEEGGDPRFIIGNYIYPIGRLQRGVVAEGNLIIMPRLSRPDWYEFGSLYRQGSSELLRFGEAELKFYDEGMTYPRLWYTPPTGMFIRGGDTTFGRVFNISRLAETPGIGQISLFGHLYPIPSTRQFGLDPLYNGSWWRDLAYRGTEDAFRPIGNVPPEYWRQLRTYLKPAQIDAIKPIPEVIYEPLRPNMARPSNAGENVDWRWPWDSNWDARPASQRGDTFSFENGFIDGEKDRMLMTMRRRRMR